MTVVILTTGGTIASKPVASGGVQASVSGEDLAAVVRRMVPGIDVRVEEVMRTGGYLMTQQTMLLLAERCRHHAQIDDVSGVVVTHGTDTLEESAYLVDLLYGGVKPIIFTGAQRNAADPDTDGPRNLRDSVRLAAHPDAQRIGVVICMDGRVDHARHATKVNSEAVRAFGSPGHGQIGEVTEHQMGIYHRSERPLHFAEVHDLPHRVDLVRLYAGIDGTFLRASREAGASGLVLEAFGLGNANHEIVDEVARLVTDGMVVLVCTRCHEGFVWPVYGNGGGYDLQEAGALFAGNLRGPKARLLLLAALSLVGPDPDAVSEVITPHLDL